jgi:hypothetical protein
MSKCKEENWPRSVDATPKDDKTGDPRKESGTKEEKAQRRMERKAAGGTDPEQAARKTIEDKKTGREKDGGKETERKGEGLWEFPTGNLPTNLFDDQELRIKRQHLEQGLRPVTGFIPHSGADLCVILYDENDRAHCHRYVRKAVEWKGYIDKRRVTHEEAFRWAANPGTNDEQKEGG